MSSITFPHATHDHTRSMSTSSSLNESGYFNSFDSASTSSFQMNPLSQHPPRTPRTSVISTATSSYIHTSASVSHIPTASRTSVDGQSSGPEALTINEDDLGSIPDVAAPLKVPYARKEDIWREIVKSSNGRDKALVRRFFTATHPLQISDRPLR